MWTTNGIYRRLSRRAEQTGRTVEDEFAIGRRDRSGARAASQLGHTGSTRRSPAQDSATGMALERSAEALLALLDTFGQMPDYSAEQVAGVLWRLHRDFLTDLSIFRKTKHSLPACAEEILRGWLEGMRIDAIANLPAAKESALARSDVTAFIDDFCGVYLPWALNAVRGYVGAISPNTAAEGWLSSWSAIAHFGLPSPKAAMFYALGLRSREAAMRCAEHYPEPAESLRLTRWLANLADDEIQRWQVTDIVRREVMAYRNLLTAQMAHDSTRDRG